MDRIAMSFAWAMSAPILWRILGMMMLVWLPGCSAMIPSEPASETDRRCARYTPCNLVIEDRGCDLPADIYRLDGDRVSAFQWRPEIRRIKRIGFYDLGAPAVVGNGARPRLAEAVATEDDALILVADEGASRILMLDRNKVTGVLSYRGQRWFSSDGEREKHLEPLRGRWTRTLDQVVTSRCPTVAR